MADTVVSTWGGGSKGWTDWTSTGGGWHQTTQQRKGDPDPSHAHIESTEYETGAFRSPVFKLSGDKIRFKIAGWDWRGDDMDAGGCFLKLAKDGTVVRWVSPPGEYTLALDDFVEVLWPVRDLKGQEVYIEVIDKLALGYHSWLGLSQVDEIADGDVTHQQFYTIPVTPRSTGIWSVMDRGTGIYLSSQTRGEMAKDIIRTPAFTLTTSVIRLAVRGYDFGHHGQCCVELLDEKSGELLRSAAPPDADTPIWVEWQTADLKGREVCIRIVDANETWCHSWIGVDEIDAGDFHVKFADDKSLEGWRLNQRPAIPMEQFGIPFLGTTSSIIPDTGSRKFDIGCKAKHLIFLGMNTPQYTVGPAYSPYVGDRLGEIKVSYADGSVEVFPLIVGESLWPGQKFLQYPEPFASSPESQKVLSNTLRLYPQRPVDNYAYISAIKPRNKTISAIEISDVHKKGGTPVILGLTIDPMPGEKIPSGMISAQGSISGDLAKFIGKMPLRREGTNEERAKRARRALSDVMYVSDSTLPNSFAVDVPKGFTGPTVRFAGDKYAELLTNIFIYNLADMTTKVTEDGMEHESSKDSPWYGYDGFGTFYKNGRYFPSTWPRGSARTLGELVSLGYMEKAKASADYHFKCARVWETEDRLKLDGVRLPRHMCRCLQQPGPDSGNFENDGHGMTTLFVYNLWKRLPDREEWLRSRWEDVAGLGNWIVWQLEHPEISKATDRLWSDSEGAGSPETFGPALYCDVACIEGLFGLVEMAESIGKTDEAKKWKATGDGLRKAWERDGLETDTVYGKRWSMKNTGWGGSSVLGPIILPVDRVGFSIEADDPIWRKYNEATYNYCKTGETTAGGMGYAFGFASQSALLLDKMDDARNILCRIASGTYVALPPEYRYVVPEAIWAPHNGYSPRFGDLGNGVQQAEIIKTFRIIVGIDDSNPSELRLLPRMPREWTEISANDFPALIERDGKREIARIDYSLKRTETGMHLDLTSDKPLCGIAVRLGAFETAPADPSVSLDGKNISCTASKSGDSHWVTFKVPAGKRRFTVVFSE